jgi:tetratricopeptide (TPR) repeat protein
LEVPDGLAGALASLRDLGLVTPVEAPATSSQDDPLSEAFLVHRWTARALADLASPAELAAAHHRAARYWRWRVKVWPQDRTAAVDQLLEARHHHLAAEELDDAVQVTEWVCTQLHTWGAWSWEARLCHQTLALVPERSRHAAAFTHQLGLIAELRGDYDQALDRYRQSLTINEELGNRAGTASSYHQLGKIAQLRGDYDQALDRYRQSLTINEELGNRADMATRISQLGILSTETGAPAEAVQWNLRSLGIRVQIRSPEAQIDLHWLTRQRELLGSQPFEQLVREQLDEESANVVLDLLERWTARGTADPGGTDPAPGDPARMSRPD